MIHWTAPPLPPQRNPYTSLTTSMSYQAITALDSLAELGTLWAGLVWKLGRIYLPSPGDAQQTSGVNPMFF